MSSNKVASLITDRIIAELEKGNIPWQKPWTGTASGPISHVSGKPYSLVNQFVLGRPGEYITYKQCIAEGGKVKKGAKALPVIFYKMNVYTDTDPDTGEEIEKTIPVLRFYTVYHIDDCEGIKAKFAKETKPVTAKQACRKAENIIKRYQKLNDTLRIHNESESNEAFYRPSTDEIVVPMMSQYEATEEYYSTLFHEMTHSTGHASRLNRLNSKAAFGNGEYSKEELVAEIGAATLVNVCGIETSKSFRNSAAYIQAWMRALKKDPNLLISASAKAEKAVEYILRTKKA